MRDIYYFLRRYTRLAYRIKGVGLGRLCEMLRRHAAKNSPSTPLQIDDFQGNSKFNCYLREHMGGQIFFRGSYSGEQLTLLARLLKSDSVFIDAGANQGEFSITAASVAKRGKVISFEPVAEYRQRLITNIQLNGFNHVQVLPIALGEQDGSWPIYDMQENFFDGTRHEGLPTLFPSVNRRHEREVVTVRRLDDVLAGLAIARVDVMKLDIEGAEWIALRGATNTLKKFHPILIFEIGRETCQAAGYEPERFAQWVIGQGYRIEKIIDGGKTQAIMPDQLGDFQNIVAYPEL
jgi:FkbM family methyltransferase